MKREIQHLLTEQAFYIGCLKGETYEQYIERIVSQEELRELDEGFEDDYYGDR